MFEKFFEKPKVEREKPKEQIAELGRNTLIKEAALEIEPKRSGGYILCTVLAMALAMGMTAGKAEAQTGGWAGFGREVMNNTVFESGSAIDRAQNAKLDRIEHEYVAQLTQLGDALRKLDDQYLRQKNQLTRQGGNPNDLRNLEERYRTEKVRLMQARADAEKAYRGQKRNSAIKKGITEAIFQGIRGW